MTKTIDYKGEKILSTAGLYFWAGLLFATLGKAKMAIDQTIKNRETGIY